MSEKNFNPEIIPSANELDKSNRKLDDKELLEREKRERAAYGANSAATAITSITQGQMPSNQQIQSALNNAQDTITQVQQSGQLTTEGRRLASETRQVVQDVQQIIAERNQDQQFQQFAEASINLAKEGAQNAQLQQLQQGWSTDSYAERSRRLVANSKIFARTLVKDQEFRFLMRDTIALLADMAGDTPFVQQLQQKASQMTGGFIQGPKHTQQQQFGQQPMMLYNQGGSDRSMFIENVPSNVYGAERNFIPINLRSGRFDRDYDRKDWNSSYGKDWNSGYGRDYESRRDWTSGNDWNQGRWSQGRQDWNPQQRDFSRRDWTSGNDWNQGRWSQGRQDWHDDDWTSRRFDRDYDRKDWNSSYGRDFGGQYDRDYDRKDWNSSYGRDWNSGYGRDYESRRDWTSGNDWNQGRWSQGRQDWGSQRDISRRDWTSGNDWNQGRWNQQQSGQNWGIQQAGSDLSHPPYWNQDKRQEIYDRLVKLLKKAASQPEWHGAIDALLDLSRDIRFDLTSGQPGAAAQQTIQGISNSQHTSTLQSSGRKIIESFSHKSIDQFVYLAQLVSVQVRENHKLVGSLKELKSMVLEILKKPDLLDNTEYSQRLNDRFNNVWYQMKYLRNSPYFRGLLNEGSEIINNITSDPLLQKLQTDTNQLMTHLIRDSNGNVKLNTALFDEVRSLLVPIIMEQLRYVPIPRITDQMHTPLGLYDVIIDNLVFSAYDIVPDRFKVKVYNNLDLNLKGLNFKGSDGSSMIRFSLRDIHCHLKDIKLFYKKAGAANFNSSLLDIDTARRGMKVKVEVMMHKQEPYFTTQMVNVNVDKLKIKMHGSKMDFLYNLVLTLSKGRIKRTIEQKIQENLVKIIGNINTALNHAIEKVPNPGSIASNLPSMGTIQNMLPSSKKDSFTSNQARPLDYSDIRSG